MFYADSVISWATTGNSWAGGTVIHKIGTEQKQRHIMNCKALYRNNTIDYLFSNFSRIKHNHGMSAGSDGIDRPVCLSPLGECLMRFLLFQLQQIPDDWKPWHGCKSQEVSKTCMPWFRVFPSQVNTTGKGAYRTHLAESNQRNAVRVLIFLERSQFDTGGSHPAVWRLELESTTALLRQLCEHIFMQSQGFKYSLPCNSKERLKIPGSDISTEQNSRAGRGKWEATVPGKGGSSVLPCIICLEVSPLRKTKQRKRPATTAVAAQDGAFAAKSSRTAPKTMDSRWCSEREEDACRWFLQSDDEL